MEVPTIVTIGLGVGTILASGVTSSIVTYRLNRTKDQFAFMRTKAEALYLAADEYGRSLSIYTIPFYGVIKGESSWSQMRDIQNGFQSQKRDYGGHETMTMLAEIYFPSVRPALAKVVEARGGFNSFTADLEQSYRARGEVQRAEWMPRMNEKTTAIDASIKCLKEAIVNAARSYAGVKQA